MMKRKANIKKPRPIKVGAFCFHTSLYRRLVAQRGQVNMLVDGTL
jgi:hypothetical protein